MRIDAAVPLRQLGELRTRYVRRIHVRPGCWGQGIGSHMHAAFVRRLREASLTVGVLEAWERNGRAQDFYARHGWKADGRHRPGPGDANYVRMRLDLSGRQDAAPLAAWGTKGSPAVENGATPETMRAGTVRL